MRIDIITLFPDYFTAALKSSIIGRAQTKGVTDYEVHQLRDFALDRGTVDDTPYGGGPGMVLKVDVMDRAIKNISRLTEQKPYVILLTPQGQQLNQAICRELCRQQRLVIICGHYEGFDERIRAYADLEISIGPYVLTGGEPAALVLVDSVVRLLPGVTGDPQSSEEESHSLIDETGQSLLEYPQYTRPEEFDGRRVPDILLSGHHGAIKKWRLEQAKARTQKRLL